MEFYIYNKEMKLSDRQPLEMLIETLGGNIDQSKYTTFVVVVIPIRIKNDLIVVIYRHEHNRFNH